MQAASQRTDGTPLRNTPRGVFTLMPRHPMLRLGMADLFRQEALDHQRQKLYGTILLARPPSFTVLTAFFVTMALALVAFFFLFGFNRKATVPGVLLPDQGLVKIYPTQAGVVIERRVADGQAVARGEVMFVLSGER